MFNRVGVIGDTDIVTMFKSVGLEVFAAPDDLIARETLRKLIKESFAVIFITEEYAAACEDILLKAKAKTFPAIISIPTAAGSTGFGLKSVKKDIEKALGADILF